MRTTRIAAALLALAAATPVHAAESLDQILGAYAAARGGLERWQAVQSLELTGRFESFSQEAPFSARWARPDFFRFESLQQDAPYLLGRDAKGSWWQLKLYGHGWPRRAEGADDIQLSRAAELEPALLGAKAKGHQVELLPPGEVDGKTTLALKLTRADGSIETWHLDPATHLEVAVDSQIFDYTQTGDPVDRRTYFSDFRSVDGLHIPFRVDAEYKARYTSLQVASAKIGGALPVEAFRLPLSAGMEALRAWAGDWQVKLEVQQNPRAPWQTVEYATTIEARDDGALLVENYRYEDPFQGPVRGERHMSWDRFSELYRFTQYDPATGQIGVLEGTMTDGVLLVSNENTRSAVKSGETATLERYRSYELGPDGWKTDGEISTDGGKTWTLVAKMTYTRKK